MLLVEVIAGSCDCRSYASISAKALDDGAELADDSPRERDLVVRDDVLVVEEFERLLEDVDVDRASSWAARSMAARAASHWRRVCSASSCE